MELDRAEEIVKDILAPKYLNSPQKMVFRAAWEGQSYRDLAATAGYEHNYIKGVGAQVWRMLATATECDVSKGNFRQVLESFVTIGAGSATMLVPSGSTRELEPAQSQIDWGDANFMPSGATTDLPRFYGREPELQQLAQWMVTDRCRLVAILGMGGMGKTTLAIELLRELPMAMLTGGDGDWQSDGFSYILWRSLLNAPPLKELLPELIRTLIRSIELRPTASDQFVPPQAAHSQLKIALMPQTVASQIEFLLEICQQHRCLIGLDNGESIFQAGAQVGQYRDGYADYGDLFTALGQIDHQSCLLITSREKPTEIGRLEGIDGKVRTLVLPGLDAIGGQQIFADRGCQPIEPVVWRQIDRYCGGNPLAFQLIAAAVQEVAAGDVREIFPDSRANNLGLADIHILLEQQWARLTSAEQQVMYWLAINREPLPIDNLTAGLHPDWNRQSPTDRPIARNSSLLTVLQFLRSRSIISTRSGQSDDRQRHWSLQPMVMEYVTGAFVNRICAEIEAQQPCWLNTQPIAQANAKEYIRQAQLRTIVQPLIERLRLRLGSPQAIGTRLRAILAKWQRSHPLQPGYLAGNLLNLLTDLNLDLTDLDCSELVIQQAYLVDIDLIRVNFTNARIVDCALTKIFGRVLAIVYSPDGETLAASDSNGEIRLWRVRDGQCLLICAGHTNWVRAIKFSPDGQYLASSSDDRCIKLWDLQTGTCLKTIGDGIHSLGLSFSPDGRHLASGSANNLIYYWDLDTGLCVREFAGHQDWSMDVNFHPHGHQLVSGSADGTVRVWDLTVTAAGSQTSSVAECQRVWYGHKNWVTTVAYSPDGKTILSGSLDGTLRLWDAPSGSDRLPAEGQECQLVLTGHGDEIWSAVFSPDGSLFASAGVGGLLRIWRTIDGQCLHHLAGHRDRLWSVAFHPDGHHLASGGEDRAIRFWQVSDGKCLQTIDGYTNWFRSIAWTPDGQRLITASRDARIRVWSLQSQTCLAQLFGHTQSTLTVASDPQGWTFASGGDDLTIRIWDAQTFACTKVLRGHTGGILALVYSPDGKYLVSGGSDHTVRIWDTQRWQCLQVWTGHTDRIGGLAYHPDLDLIASASEDCTIRIWHLHHNAPVHILAQHTNRAIAVAFDPDGAMLASGGMDGRILLWNIATGELCQTLTGSAEWILSLAYSPDGKWLFSGAADDTIRVWSIATGLCINTFTGHQSWVWSVAVSACGRFLASASEDETIRIWDLPDGNIRSTRRATRPYEGMNITGIKGLTAAQLDELKALGARE